MYIFSAHYPANEIASLVTLYKVFPASFFVYLFIQQIFENLFHARHSSGHCEYSSGQNRQKSRSLWRPENYFRNFALWAVIKDEKVRVGSTFVFLQVHPSLHFSKCWLSDHSPLRLAQRRHAIARGKDESDLLPGWEGMQERRGRWGAGPVAEGLPPPPANHRKTATSAGRIQDAGAMLGLARGWELPAQHLSSPRAPEPGRGGGERGGQARLSREDSNPRAGKATASGSGCSPWVPVIFSCLCILEEWNCVLKSLHRLLLLTLQLKQTNGEHLRAHEPAPGPPQVNPLPPSVLATRQRLFSVAGHPESRLASYYLLTKKNWTSKGACPSKCFAYAFTWCWVALVGGFTYTGPLAHLLSQLWCFQFLL